MEGGENAQCVISITMTAIAGTDVISCPAFTRTLTILYSTTLLSLFTTVQLSVLGRSKYVQAVSQQEREERMNARKRTIELAATRTGMLIVSKMLAGLNDQDEDGEGETEVITEEVEMVYLTLSWWLLHVGWKDIGERVRRGVEEVFDK
jgi:peroxin-3